MIGVKIVLVNSVQSSVSFYYFVYQFFLYVKDSLNYHFIEYIFEPILSFCIFWNFHNFFVWSSVVSLISRIIS